MRKLKLFFAFMLMAVLSIGQMWAVDYDLVYTLDGTNTSCGGSSAYDAAGNDVVQNEIHWAVVGNVTMNPWRIGGKNLTGVDRSVSSKSAISDDIAKVEITHGAASNITVNSMTVVVSKNSDFSNPVSTLTPSFVANNTVTINRPAGKDWSNCYYKIIYNVSVSGKTNRFIQFTNAKFYKEQAASDVATPTFSPVAGVYTSAQSVTISCETTGSTIYYTTDGSAPDNTKTQYTSAINVSETETIKAIAYVGSTASNVATAEYTIVTPLASMEEIFAASATAGNYYITFNSNWVVTGVSSNGQNVYITDGTKGMILYNNGGNIGLAAGNTLSGTKQCSLTRYGGAAEISNFSIAGLTKGTGTLPAVQELSEEEVAALSAVNTGALIKVSGEYTAASYVGGAKLYNAIMGTLPSMTVGSAYECTGVYIYYKKNNTTDAVNEIAPRTTDDIEEVQPATLDEVTGLAALKAAERGSYYVNLTNAVVSYVNGNNALIEDANAGALIYLSNHGFNAGDCLNGKYQVTTTDHQGKFEITAIEAQTGAAKTTAEIPLTTLTITQLNANFSSYESRRVKIVGANVTDAISGDDRNGAINDGAAVAVYAAAGKNVITLTADDNVDIIGYPGYYNTDEQLNVWRQEDITVNSSEPPVVDPRKVAASPTEGFSSISGDLSGNEISFAAYQGGSATAPNGNNTAHELRLYKYQATTEYGGYLTITAKDGCTIDQVVITVSANCSVGWCKDAEELPTKESTPIAIGTSSPFDTGTGLNASSVSVVNLHGSNQFKITSITVYYTGEAITLQSIAISGTATALEYNEGDEFDPAGLVVTGHYSDNSDAEITDGITWAFDPATLSVGTTSVSVTATVGELTSDAVVVNGLTVNEAVAPTPSTDNVVILATHGTKLYAMSTTNSNNAFAAIVVEEDGSNIVVTSEEAKAAIQWTRSSNGITATFQDANSKYLTATNGSTNLSLGEDECVWKWYAGEGKNCYSIENEDETKLRSFLYYSNNGIFKNYALSNAGGNYSGITEVRVIAAENIVVVVPTTHTVSYNANGGTLISGEDPIADAQVAEGATVTVAANVYEKEDYMFAGWLYGETVYQAGQTFGMPTEDVELVAQWNPVSVSDYVLVTDVAQLKAGDKVIIVAADYNVAAGSAAATYRSTVEIAKTSDKSHLIFGASMPTEFTLGIMEDGYAFADVNGYMYESAAKSVKSQAEPFAWSISIDAEAIATISADNELRYNSTSPRFTTYASGQQDLQIYRKPSEFVEARNGLSAGRYYTICMEKNIMAVKNASFWSLTYKDAEQATEVYLVEETAPLVAGKPYIFQAGAATLDVIYGDKVVAAPIENGALRGTFTGIDAEAFAALTEDPYLLIENMLRPRTDGNYLNDHRAYVAFEALTVPETPNFAPGKRVRAIPMQPQVATGVDALNATEAPVKMIINGQLFILRGEKMYNVNGQLVK